MSHKESKAANILTSLYEIGDTIRYVEINL